MRLLEYLLKIHLNYLSKKNQTQQNTCFMNTFYMKVAQTLCVLDLFLMTQEQVTAKLSSSYSDFSTDAQ